MQSTRHDTNADYIHAMTHRPHTTDALALHCRARGPLAIDARDARQWSTCSAAFIGGFAAT